METRLASWNRVMMMIHESDFVWLHVHRLVLHRKVRFVAAVVVVAEKDSCKSKRERSVEQK